jgi:hypothetical protein
MASTSTPDPGSQSTQPQSQNRRARDRRRGQRREEDVPIDFPDPRSGIERRIGSRRTGVELKFCSNCGKKITTVPAIPTGGNLDGTTRYCADCARERGLV